MNQLIKILKKFRSPNVFNPWAESDPLDVAAAGASDREARLRAHFACDAALLLVGEAPGYQGCHFSGVPFTNEKLLMEGAIPRIAATRRFTTRELPWSEPSATIVWRTLHDLGLAERTVMWNAFAWHPNKPGSPLSNRAPTRSELEAGQSALLGVLRLFKGVAVVPVGNVASRKLQQMGVSTKSALRHPAYGGATEFRDGLAALARSQFRRN